MPEFFDVIATRESCRNYLDRPVEKELLTRLVEAARLSPSACNSQPWDFVAVTGPALPSQVASCVQDMGMNKFASKVPAFLIITQGDGNLSSKLGGKVKKLDYTSMDIGIAAAHICLAATALGLSSCILGWFQEEKLKALLNLPPKKKIRLVICVGYSADYHLRPKARRPLPEIITYME